MPLQSTSANHPLSQLLDSVGSASRAGAALSDIERQFERNEQMAHASNNLYNYGTTTFTVAYTNVQDLTGMLQAQTAYLQGAMGAQVNAFAKPALAKPETKPFTEKPEVPF